MSGNSDNQSYHPNIYDKPIYTKKVALVPPERLGAHYFKTRTTILKKIAK